MKQHAPEYDSEQWENTFPAIAYDERLHYWTGPAKQIGFHLEHPYQRLGFDYVSQYEAGKNTSPHVQTKYIVLPYWLLIAVFAAFPFVRMVRWAVRFPRERRRRRGLCAFCGYDLRGTPDACPECGKAVLREAPAVGA